jgi:hypothetical protein
MIKIAVQKFYDQRMKVELHLQQRYNSAKAKYHSTFSGVRAVADNDGRRRAEVISP